MNHPRDPEDEANLTGEQPVSEQHGAIVARELAYLAEQRERAETGGPLAKLASMGAESSLFLQSQTGEQYEAFQVTEEGFARMQHHVLEVLKEQGKGEFPDIPAAVTALGPKLIRREAIDGYNMNASDTSYLMALVVLTTYPNEDEWPEGAPRDKVPKLPKESLEHAALRNGLTYLREIVSPMAIAQLRAQSDRGKARLAETSDLVERSQADPDNEELAQEAQKSLGRAEWDRNEFLSASTAIRFSGALLKQLKAGWPYPREETIQALQEMQKSREHEELDWIVMPHEPTQRQAMIDQETSGLPPEVKQYRQERLDELDALAEEWGNGARVFMSQLRGKGGDRYYVAVLPQQLPDGRWVEHAVADHAEEGNARFVWRAELGFTEPGEPLTWRQVFGKDQYKSWIKTVAKKIVHKHDWRERTMEYLTRGEQDL